MNEERRDRILVVDDGPYVRSVLIRHLEADGYACGQASNGVEALTAMRSDTYSLVITDILMPGMTGIELLEALKKDFPEVGVIMLTAVDDRPTAIRALHAGAYGYVIKPFDANEVLISVANALERCRLEHLSRTYQQQLEQEVRERTAQVHEREMEIVTRLMSASEYRDDETGSHIRRIGLYAEAVAKTAGWGLDAADSLRLAAPMHDIGKTGVPDQILLKPGKLTTEEFEVVKDHAKIGARILSNSRVPFLRAAKAIALSHHEWWDGTSYPQGLGGDAIPAEARLVAVVDVYDALTSRRAYRPALPESEALEIMTSEKGTHFAPDLFEAFLCTLPELRTVRELVDAA